MLCPSVIEYLTKPPINTGHKKSPLELLVKGEKKTIPKYYGLFIFALCCLSEIGGKYLLLRKASNSAIRLRIWAGADMKASSMRLALTVLKGVMQVAKRWKQPIVLRSCDAYELQQWPAQQSSPKSAIVASYFEVSTSYFEVTNICLVVVKVWSHLRNHVWD